MNKDQTIGMLLIALLFVGYIIYTQPSKEQLETARRVQDSLALVEQQNLQKQIQNEVLLKQQETLANENPDLFEEIVSNRLQSEYGRFAESASGDREFITLENDLIELKISNQGGYIYSATLKEYRTHDSLPLVLFTGDSTIFNFTFTTTDRLAINTQDMFFVNESGSSSLSADQSAKSLSMRLYAGENEYIEYLYTIHPNEYMIDFNINFVQMGDVIPRNLRYLTLNWACYIPGQEKGWKFENQYTGIYFRPSEQTPEYLSERSDYKSENISTNAQWISYKQQFFSTILIAKDNFNSAFMEQKVQTENGKHLKYMNSEIGLPYQGGGNESILMSMYFGPNHYKTLKEYDLYFEKLIPLGWGIFGWINKYAVILLFDFLGSFFTNYGLVILLLTIILKMVLFPFTYRSYMSTAKMRVMKPQIDEATKNIPKEDTMVRQQKTMEIYRKAGVSPMGGCLPMLLQMPILIAMFQFFPASIELRQKSFLWANDLSSYDAIFSWTTNIPILSSIYGNHVSLFTLLMTISTVIYTRMNQSQMGDVNSQMPGMKTMMYIFPVMMLFWFNNYASGLSYYYLLANLITFGQMFLIKRFVDEEQILKQLEANKKKPTKKSSFQERLEKMAKEKGYQAPKKK